MTASEVELIDVLLLELERIQHHGLVATTVYSPSLPVATLMGFLSRDSCLGPIAGRTAAEPLASKVMEFESWNPAIGSCDMQGLPPATTNGTRKMPTETRLAAALRPSARRDFIAQPPGG
jgi:hypothetical protein